MSALFAFLAREPAMVVAIVLATLNMVVSLNAEQQLHVQTIVESLLVILGGGIVRQNVKPMTSVRKDDAEHERELADVKEELLESRVLRP